MMTIKIECCGNVQEIVGNKITADQTDNFDFYINSNGLFVIECERCNNRIRFKPTADFKEVDCD